MNRILILSICLKEIKPHHYEFHFKGAYLGYEVKSILLLSSSSFKKGEEYLIWAEFLGFEGSKLRARVLSFKKLDECIDRS